MHKRLLCSHLPRSLKKLEGSAVLIIFVYYGSEEKGRSKEKQEEEEERQRPDARRKQKSKLEEASQSHRLYHLSAFISDWVHALCAALIFVAPCAHLSRRRGEAVNPAKQARGEQKKQEASRQARSKKQEERRKKKEERRKLEDERRRKE